MMRRGEIQDNLYCLQELRVRFKNTVNRYFISSLSLSHVLSQILYELRIARQKNEYNYQIHSFSLCQGLHRRLPRCTSGGLEMEGWVVGRGHIAHMLTITRLTFFSGLAKCELSQHCPHCPHVSSRVTCHTRVACTLVHSPTPITCPCFSLWLARRCGWCPGPASPSTTASHPGWPGPGRSRPLE